ncbi:MAG: DUF3793 family protein [Tissierellia bacterium]|nr:DUF3793 family protein [Tissierellia bacterium]
MYDKLLINHCSPTLAGIKTGNILSLRYDTKTSFREEISKLNKTLLKKGVRLIPLKYSEGRVLVYVYRPSSLAKDLTDEKAREILNKMGYDTSKESSCLIKLIKKLKESKDFPHEIGLFLGYPPEDVKGFILKKKEKHSGYWKVYYNLEEALKTFEKFNNCFKTYREKFETGFSIERLTVSTEGGIA